MSDGVDAAIPLSAGSKPKHIAIIMDGNNRWAKQRKKIGISGHKAGVEAVRSVVSACVEEGIEVLTLFAFSSENWRRPEEEVGALMKLFVLALQQEVKKLNKNNIRLKIIGERTRFSPVLQELMDKAEELTKDNTAMTLVVAANYGGHWDITNATKALARKVESGLLKSDEITEDLLQAELSIGDMAMPDLMIRTAGENRISNFMLWQLAYTEFYFSDLYWPDFDGQQLRQAIEVYSGRKRRFGQTDDQIANKT